MYITKDRAGRAWGALNPLPDLLFYTRFKENSEVYRYQLKRCK